jgi:hypothetical protein
MQYYVHNVPGRLRIKNPIFKNRNNHDTVKKILSVLEGIGTVDFNATTGSILVYYNPSRIDHRDILHALQRKGYFDPQQTMTNDQYVQKAASKAMNIVSKSVAGAFVEKALEGSALSFLAFLL